MKWLAQFGDRDIEKLMFMFQVKNIQLSYYNHFKKKPVDQLK